MSKQRSKVLITVCDATHTVSVSSPYNRDFVAKAKSLGGRWSDRVWVFDAQRLGDVREACRYYYGTDGDTIDTVRVRVTFVYNVVYAETDDVRMSYGKRYVNRRFSYRIAGRNVTQADHFCRGVRVISGGIDFNSDPKYPQGTIRAGTVIELQALTRAAVDEAIGADDRVEITIIA